MHNSVVQKPNLFDTEELNEKTFWSVRDVRTEGKEVTNSWSKSSQKILVVVLISLCALLAFSVSINTNLREPRSNRRLQELQLKHSVRSFNDISSVRLAIYSGSFDHDGQETAVARKFKHDIEQYNVNGINSFIQIDSINHHDDIDMLEFVLEHCGQEAFQRMSFLSKEKPHWMLPLYQWCALTMATNETSTVNAVLFIDAGSPVVLNHHYPNLITYLEEYVVQSTKSKKLPNMVVQGTKLFPNTIHGSFLLLRKTTHSHELAKRMLHLLLDSDEKFEALESNALLFSQSLYKLINKQAQKQEWYFLEQRCRMDAPRRQKEYPSDELIQHNLAHISCPLLAGYCCSIQDRNGVPLTVLLSKHPVLPFQTIETSSIMTPYNINEGMATSSILGGDEFPYISTISESSITKPQNFGNTPTFYEILSAKHCLPADDRCSRCLREKQGANCHSCGSVCHCYCKSLCNPDERPRSRHIAKKVIVTPPSYRRDPSRLIPRIVHQTWFEELSTSKYPNMSRLVQSFNRSGWEYKFYTDENAREFLTIHFPKEVKEAYDILRPGAFKADLFRYCVLLIHGGVYADVDIQLEAALDLAIAPDIGFMVPIDEPGKPIHRQMCLWNGLIAAAPGHAFLAKAIETIVNQVRNRYTSVDTDETFCEYHDDKEKIKSPELSVLHAYDTLFTAGPCLLGSSINRVLGRSGQTGFHPGELKGIWDDKHYLKTTQGTSFVIGIPGESRDDHHNQARIQGRTIILHQNKWDMGAHRFTMVEENLVIAATDLPDSNDRLVKVEEGSKTETVAHEHYSKAHSKTGVYGVENLYYDRVIANEDIQIFIDASRHSNTFLKPTAVLS